MDAAVRRPRRLAPRPARNHRLVRRRREPRPLQGPHLQLMSVLTRQVPEVSPVVAETLAAVRSVLGTPERLVPLHEPEFAGREWECVKECIDTGWVSSV